ncbi:MAG TPA: RDD family protein [Anaerolineales bacterium]|nr:RDD family protein [Anaerolineales bacterium]
MKTYAGFWKRTGAFALDYIVILGYLIGIALLSLLANAIFGVNEWLFADRIRAQFVAFLIVTLPVTLYFAISESSASQATWGKRRLKLKVVDRNRNQIGIWRSLARTLLKFIPWELSHTLIWQIYFSPQIESIWISYGFTLVYLLMGLNIASLLLTKSHQTLYDLLTNTYVVHSS